MKEKIGKEVAESMLDGIYEDLGVSLNLIDDEEDKSTNLKLINSIMMGRLVYETGVFKLQLLKPITAGSKEISFLEIPEPSGSDLREMASVQKKNDDVGKAMAVLGSVTGHGLPLINKLGSRDMMVAVGVISLFL